MDERGQSTLEAVLILALSLSLVAAGVSAFKNSQPRRWSELAEAVSDVSRDLSWQYADAVAAWTGRGVSGSLRASLARAEIPQADGRAYLRPAADPLKQIQALR